MAKVTDLKMFKEETYKNRVWQFVVELEDFKPRVWRRFQIGSKSELQDFCYAVMAMFNCVGGHLHLLRVENNGVATVYQNEPDGFMDVDFGGFEGAIPVKHQLMEGKRVDDIFKIEKDNATLEYDFGDGWEFKITLEKTNAESTLVDDDFAIALTGKGYGIIEDCGGVWGLNEICQALASGKATGAFDSIEEMERWLMNIIPDFDSFKSNGFEHFNLEDINEDLEDLQYLRDFYTGEFFK